jgi:hypothetical protein
LEEWLGCGLPESASPFHSLHTTLMITPDNNPQEFLKGKGAAHHYNTFTTTLCCGSHDACNTTNVAQMSLRIWS